MSWNAITSYGVTTDSYTDNTISMNVDRKTFKSVSVKNKHSSTGLKFVITAYYDKNEEAYDVLKSENTLAHGEIYNYGLNFEQFDHIKVTLKNAVAATRCDWLVVFNVR